MLIAASALAAVPARAASVVDVRIAAGSAGTRVTVALSQPAAFHVFTLSGPDRVVVDFRDLSWRAIDAGDDVGGGLVSKVRHGPFDPHTLRLVLDLSGPARVAGATLRPGAPARFVLDLQPSDAAAFTAALHRAVDGGPDSGPDGAAPVAATASATPAARPADPPAAPFLPPVPPDEGASLRVPVALRPPVRPAPPTPVAPAGKPLIALDAGHGGIDPGTTGVGGLYEKTITLATARAVAAVLEASGRYHVMLTRDSDVFVPLFQRVAKARSAHANLFISLHADSASSSDADGASIYTLSDKASDREAAVLAAKENRSDAIAGVNLENQNDQVASILISLAQRATINQSSLFAGDLVHEMRADRIRLRARPHLEAGLAVLTAADTPAVLIEMGYLSNPVDAKLLTEDSHRRVIARAILAAVDDFFRAKAPQPKS